MKLNFVLFFMKWIVVWPLQLNEWSKVLIFYCWRHWTRYNWWVLYWKTFIKRQSIIGINFFYPSILRTWLQYHSLKDCFYTKEIIHIEEKCRTILHTICLGMIDEKFLDNTWTIFIKCNWSKFYGLLTSFEVRLMVVSYFKI